MDEEEKKEQSAVERVGIDFALKLSFAAVDKSSAGNKRDILYSLVCFGCMFDEKYATEPDPIVRKYDCLKLPEPKKLELYELALTILTLDCEDVTAKELRTAWYMLFAYIILGEAPYEEEAYARISAALQSDEVFDEVLKSRYSVYIPATVEELKAQGAPAPLIEWYAPYLDYCAQKDEHGVSREVLECRRLLALGRGEEALLRGERRLAAYPDDTEAAISVIAARVSLSGVTDRKSREILLKDTLSLIDDYIDVSSGQYFRYYRGLTLLGLMDTAGARREFEACLEADPSFELAALMLRGMDKYEA